MKTLLPTKQAKKFSKFLPHVKKAADFCKENWSDIAVVAAVVLIADDVDTAAEMAEGSFFVDVLTAQSEGVI